MAQKIGTANKRSLWLGYAVTGLLTLMLCLTINYRAYSDLSGESNENESLKQRIEAVTSENLALQEQIHYLKHDPKTIEREVRKFGLRKPKE